MFLLGFSRVFSIISSMPRDFQRSKMPEIEREFRGTRRAFATINEAQTYVDVVRCSRWFKRRWPELTKTGVVVKPLYTRAEDFEFHPEAKRSTLFPVIYLPSETGSLFEAASTSWTETLVLHLLAHHCVRGSTHSRAWARTWLFLVRREMGIGAGRELRELLVKHRVKYLDRKLSDEQRERLRKNFMERVPRAFPEGS